jgi:hypothetical protein
MAGIVNAGIGRPKCPPGLPIADAHPAFADSIEKALVFYAAALKACTSLL